MTTYVAHYPWGCPHHGVTGDCWRCSAFINAVHRRRIAWTPTLLIIAVLAAIMLLAGCSTTSQPTEFDRYKQHCQDLGGFTSMTHGAT